MYEILTSKEFFERYRENLKVGEFRFITKAYRQSDNTIALFEKENDVDCYFQLPNWKTTKVPDKRKWVYKLPKNSIQEGNHIKMDDGRYKIPVDSLQIWDDPYEETYAFEDAEIIEDFPEVEEKKSVIGLLEKIDFLEEKINEKINYLELCLNKLSVLESKVLETLKRFDYVNKN